MTGRWGEGEEIFTCSPAPTTAMRLELNSISTTLIAPSAAHYSPH